MEINDKKSEKSNLELLKTLTGKLNTRDKEVYESEKKFRNFFCNSAAAMCILNTKTGKIIDANSQMCDWTGYSKEELLSNPSSHFVMYSDADCADGFKKDCPRKYSDFTNVYKHKDGSKVYLRWHGTEPDENGINYNVGINVTKEVEQERELVLSEKLYRRITEESKEIICLHNPDGTYKYVSPSTTKILGWKSSELLNESPYKFIHPDDEELVQNELHDKVLNKNETNPIRIRFRTKVRSYVWLEVSVTPFFNLNGDVVELKTVSIDLSNVIQLEHNASTNEEIYKQIVHNSNELIKLYKVEKGGVPKLIYVSPSCINYTGFTPKEHIKMQQTQLIHPRDIERVVPKMMDILNKKEKITVEYRALNKFSGYKWIQSIVSPIFSPNQEVKYLLMSSRVVRDIKKNSNNQELVKANKKTDE